MNVESTRPLSSKEVERVYGTREPTIINQILLKAACYAQGPKEEAGRIARIEGITFKTVKQLSLGFQNILKMSNLDEFVQLTTLKLDNNIIEKIENLDRLVNLQALDLSFNRISVIENLTKLSKLEDLSLYRNEIIKIEGLHQLTHLKYLSLGDNHISDLENLRSITLAGNPMASDEKYKTFVCAILSDLEYLDYKQLSHTAKAEAYQIYQITVDQLNDKRSEEEKQKDTFAERDQLARQYANAFVQEVDGDNLFKAIIDGDPDGQKFLPLPLVAEVIEQYNEKLTDACRMLFTFGLEEFQRRTAEESALRGSINEAKASDREDGIKLVQDFQDFREYTMNRLERTADTQIDLIEEILMKYRENIHHLWEKLMANEMVISEQIEEVCKEFERNINDMVTYFVEAVQNYFSKCREAASNFHERLIEATLPYAERLAKADPSETETLMFPDRESMNNTLLQSKDNQLFTIDQCEEHITSGVTKWCNNLVQQLLQEECLKRHIDRVTEINLFIDAQRTELESFDLVII